MSSETPRPLSQPQDGLDQMIFPVLASAIQAARLPVCSWALRSSGPARLGIRSPTCIASPCPCPFTHSPAPLSSIAIVPYTTSSLPSPSTSATDNWWLPWSVQAEPLVDELLSKVH